MLAPSILTQERRETSNDIGMEMINTGQETAEEAQEETSFEGSTWYTEQESGQESGCDSPRRSAVQDVWTVK